MIPAVLHRVWLGSWAKRPEQYDKAWASLHPDWTIVNWDDSVFTVLQMRLERELAGMTDLRQRSCLLRLELLATFGGVYVDYDVEPLKPLDPLLDTDLFIGREDANYVCNAVIGARKGHPYLDLVMDGIPDNLKLGYKTISQQTGPIYHSEKLATWPYLELGEDDYLAGSFPKDDDVVLPPVAFYPYHHQELARAGESFPDSFAVHHWQTARGGYPAS